MMLFIKRINNRKNYYQISFVLFIIATFALSVYANHPSSLIIQASYMAFSQTNDIPSDAIMIVNEISNIYYRTGELKLQSTMIDNLRASVNQKSATSCLDILPVLYKSINSVLNREQPRGDDLKVLMIYASHLDKIFDGLSKESYIEMCKKIKKENMMYMDELITPLAIQIVLKTPDEERKNLINDFIKFFPFQERSLNVRFLASMNHVMGRELAVQMIDRIIEENTMNDTLVEDLQQSRQRILNPPTKRAGGFIQ